MYYYHFDGLGSTRLLTSDTGTVTDTYSYDAFGNLINHTGTTENPFLFTGQQYDSNIGFYYLRARYYQQNNGRFMAIDPFAGDPYSPMSLHKYLYANADPVNKVDLSGEFVSFAEAGAALSGISILAMIMLPALHFMSIKETKKCYNIKIKRKHIHLFGDDKYGHWWIEIRATESYGWWPKYPVGIWETLRGVEGELNGQTSYGGTATSDPHHGDSAEDTFHPRISANCSMSCTNAEFCVREFAWSFVGGWSWPWGPNCHTFQESMMKKCCLEK
jgi:RHS repeat-associated protein